MIKFVVVDNRRYFTEEDPSSGEIKVDVEFGSSGKYDPTGQTYSGMFINYLKRKIESKLETVDLSKAAYTIEYFREPEMKLWNDVYTVYVTSIGKPLDSSITNAMNFALSLEKAGIR